MSFPGEFDNYTVTYYTGNSPLIGMPFDAVITCNLKSGVTNITVGDIVFLPDGAKLPENVRDKNNRIMLYYHTSRFADIMTMIKEEKPLYIGLRTNKVGSIGTNMESIGEQEGV